MTNAIYRKDTLEVNGRKIRMVIGGVSFELRMNAALLGKIVGISKRVDEEDEKITGGGYSPEELSRMFCGMLDELLGRGASSRIFGRDLPVPADVCEVIIFVVRQIRCRLGV
ncbi:MAG: hypothetical protein IKX86_04200 [Clostridia bacterium]|nr:hypothetical protein [Clostridia bacterium]